MERPTSSSAKVQNAGTASMLVATVADLMSLYMQSGHLNHLSVFSDLCLSLAKSAYILLYFCLLINSFTNCVSRGEADLKFKRKKCTSTHTCILFSSHQHNLFLEIEVEFFSFNRLTKIWTTDCGQALSCLALFEMRALFTAGLILKTWSHKLGISCWKLIKSLCRSGYVQLLIYLCIYV